MYKDNVLRNQIINEYKKQRQFMVLKRCTIAIALVDFFKSAWHVKTRVIFMETCSRRVI